MIYFTSDLHLNHRNIAKGVSVWSSGFRDFPDTHSMDEHILNNINKYVNQDDELYILGDIYFGSRDGTLNSISRIICKNKHFIIGNHDKDIRNHPLRYANSFESVQYYKEIIWNKTRICLFHYAQVTWNQQHRGSWQLYGHSHSRLPERIGKQMDVGIDNIYKLFGEYRPISVEEVARIMEKKEITSPDGHNK